MSNKGAETFEEFLRRNQIDTRDQSLPAASRPLPGSKEAQDRSYLEARGWGESRDKYRMDRDKLEWHKDRLLPFVQGERVAPLHIDMGISTGCNLACHFCYGVPQGRQGFEARGGKMQFMPLSTIQQVFADAKEVGVRSIALIGEAENTLNPDLYPALQFAREIDLDVSLATHGANIGPKQVEGLLATLQWLRVNIGAATPESYMRVHQRPWLDRVLIATELLVKERAAHGYTNRKGLPTTLGYQMVLTDRNLDQVVPLVKLGRELGIDYTVVKACSDTPDGRIGAPHEKYLELANVFREAESYAADDYQVVIRWEKLGNLGNKEYGLCHGTRFIIAISGDGTVFPCGHWFAIERERFGMGNVNETPLKEIVRSDRYWGAQEEIHKVDLRFCETNCRQHGVNKRLYQIMTKPDPVSAVNEMEEPSHIPAHVNFI